MAFKRRKPSASIAIKRASDRTGYQSPMLCTSLAKMIDAILSTSVGGGEGRLTIMRRRHPGSCLGLTRLGGRFVGLGNYVSAVTFWECSCS
jgi:hypothetical protein